MKIYDCKQGDQTWIECRLGIPTCSCFDRLITPKTRKPSAQAERYAHELCAEWLLGQPLDMTSSQWMARGTELEAEAISWFEFDTGQTVTPIGFAVADNGRWGGSPDGLIGENGIIEVKCLSAVNHVAALLGATDDGYVLQAQGYLLLTGRKWIDRLWYNPAITPAIQRVDRDEELCCLLAASLEAFCERLDIMKTKLAEQGNKPKGT